MNSILKHYGIKGQKWGVRNYQYEDGRYTPEGKERYFGSKERSYGAAWIPNYLINNNIDLSKEGITDGKTLMEKFKRKLTEKFDFKSGLILKNSDDTAIEDDLKRVNPDFYTNPSNSNHVNCVPAVLVFALRRFGYDATVKKSDLPVLLNGTAQDGDGVKYDTSKGFSDLIKAVFGENIIKNEYDNQEETNKLNGSYSDLIKQNKENAKKILEKDLNNGDVACVTIKNEHAGLCHEVAAVKQDNKIYLADPQDHTIYDYNDFWHQNESKNTFIDNDNSYVMKTVVLDKSKIDVKDTQALHNICYSEFSNDFSNNSLSHYGIKGQKWGVRNYQYEDGRYTPEGLERYFPNSEHKVSGEVYTDKFSENEGPMAVRRFKTKQFTQNKTAILKGKNTLTNIIKSYFINKKAEKDISTRRKSEEFDENIGLYKKKSNDTSIENDLANVNPEYANNKVYNKNNCVLCSSSFVLRRLGYDAVANYTNGSNGVIADNDLGKTTKKIFGENSCKYSSFNKDLEHKVIDSIRKRTNIYNEIKDEIKTNNSNQYSALAKNMKNNDIAMMFVANPKHGTCHAVNVVKNNDKLYFVDSQSYTKYKSECYMDLKDYINKSSSNDGRYSGNTIVSTSVINKDGVDLNKNVALNIAHDSLSHYGIKGQKWGVRNYQYKDGTYTPEGKERYFGNSEESVKKDKSNTSATKSKNIIQKIFEKLRGSKKDKDTYKKAMSVKKKDLSILSSFAHAMSQQSQMLSNQSTIDTINQQNQMTNNQIFNNTVQQNNLLNDISNNWNTINTINNMSSYRPMFF